MKRKQYTKQFKVEAVRLLEQTKKPAAELARELGVRRNQLYKWKRALTEQGEEAAFRRPGRRSGSHERADYAELKRRVAQLEEENAILKKAAAYFAKELR